MGGALDICCCDMQQYACRYEVVLLKWEVCAVAITLKVLIYIVLLVRNRYVTTLHGGFKRDKEARI